MKKILSLLFVVAVLAGCSKKEEAIPSPVLVSETEEITDGSQLKRNNDCNDDDEFKGKELKGSMIYHYTESFDLPCNCGIFSSAGNYYGTGKLSHLGNSTSKIKPCISMIFSGSTPIGVHVGEECGFFQSANGDIVNCVTLPYDMYFTSTGGLTGTLKVKFSGGTGKFKYAKGGFNGYTTNDGQGTVTLDILKGAIDY